MPAIDHDSIFKQLLTEFFTEFLELFLPEAFVTLDRETSYAVARVATRVIDLLAFGRVEVSSYVVGCGGFAATAHHLDRVYHAAAGYGGAENAPPRNSYHL